MKTSFKMISPWNTARLLFTSSRPISWINTAFPFAAAYTVTGGVIDSIFVLSLVYFLIPYNILIYVVNDVYDYESDVRNPRKNSIEGGLLAPNTHATMLVCTAFINGLIIVLLSLQNSRLLPLLLLCALTAVIYSVPKLRFKERPFLDSITSSLHFVLPMVYGLAIGGIELSHFPYIASFFLWGCASHMFGAVQDILPDRSAGLRSIATYLGAQSTVRLSQVLYILSAIILGINGWPEVLVAVALLVYPTSLVPYMFIDDQKSDNVNRPWRQFIIVNQFVGTLITIIIVYGAVYG